jgi:hypothetical protein
VCLRRPLSLRSGRQSGYQGDPEVLLQRVAGAASGGAHIAAVIWSPNLGVFAVSAGGVLYAFAAWRTRYLDSVSAGRLTRIPFSLLFLELSGYCLNVVRRHVSAADVLVRCGVDRDDSR